MPSPFPGMDPYLENPGLWPDVHHELISVARELLIPQLLPRYVATVELRTYISDENDLGLNVIVPDVQIRESAHAPQREPARNIESTVVQTVEPVSVVTLIDKEVREAYLKILDRQEKKVVTIIEIVSPSNKVVGSFGRAEYFKKRAQTMVSDTHLVEIDLLRAGTKLPFEGEAPDSDYRIHISRSHERPQGWLWPIQVKDRLPEIPIPLQQNDDEARLDLQEVLNTAYTRAAYDALINYSEPPVPELRGEAAQWAEAIVRNGN